MADWYFRNNQTNQGQQTQGSLMPCPSCRNLVRKGEEFCPYCARRLRPESGARAWVRKMLATPFVATRGLILFCVAMFMVQMLADVALPAAFKPDMGNSGLFDLGTASPITYIRLGSNFMLIVARHQQFWRFVTACFLHFGILHILMNCWVFKDIGYLAERFWGAKQVFATFVLTGLCGSAASYLWHVYRGINVNSAGASGAIFGVAGLFIGAYYKNKHQVGEVLGAHLLRWVITMLVMGLVMRVVDNAAHIGGVLSGAVLGYFLPPTNFSRTLARDTKIWNAAAIASVVLLVVAFAIMIAFFARGPEHVLTL